MRDKQDYQALMDEKLHRNAQAKKETFVEFIRADLELDKITASKGWDTYLEFLRGIKNNFKDAHQVLEKEHNESYDLGETALRENKIQMILNRERLELLDLVMTLPKLIGDSARAARKAIKKYEKS